MKTTVFTVTHLKKHMMAYHYKKIARLFTSKQCFCLQQFTWHDFLISFLSTVYVIERKSTIYFRLNVKILIYPYQEVKKWKNVELLPSILRIFSSILRTKLRSLNYLNPGSHLEKKCFFICFSYSPSKMMKNAFYFILKALFVIKIFKGTLMQIWKSHWMVLFI